jgi:hypothetical protein
MAASREQYDELYVYAMSRPGSLLQHVADAFSAQTADGNSKPISIVFALVGLYLYVEKEFSGFQVQKVHTLLAMLAMRKRVWPRVLLPAELGAMTVIDVLAASAGSERDKAIYAWCHFVWSSFHDSRKMILALLAEYDIR